MIDTTIISLIDNNLEPSLWNLCKDYLIWSAQDVPIISVSQEPVELGTNVCVGKIGRSLDSIWMQLLAGAQAATTRFVAVSEQDNLYPQGYFNFQASRDDTFYYNFNYVILHRTGNLDGLFGVNNDIRFALSQMVCNRQLLIDALTWAIGELDAGNTIKYSDGLIIEPGAWKNLFNNKVDLKFTKYDFYWDGWPSVDVRHGRNFTRQKRQYRMLSPKVIYWGTVDDVWNKKPMVEPCLEI